MRLITVITQPLSMEASSFVDDLRFAYLFQNVAGGVADKDGSIAPAIKAFHAILLAHSDESGLGKQRYPCYRLGSQHSCGLRRSGAS